MADKKWSSKTVQMKNKTTISLRNAEEQKTMAGIIKMDGYTSYTIHDRESDISTWRTIKGVTFMISIYASGKIDIDMRVPEGGNQHNNALVHIDAEEYTAFILGDF